MVNRRSDCLFSKLPPRALGVSAWRIVEDVLRAWYFVLGSRGHSAPSVMRKKYALVAEVVNLHQFNSFDGRCGAGPCNFTAVASSINQEHGIQRNRFQYLFVKLFKFLGPGSAARGNFELNGYVSLMSGASLAVEKPWLICGP